MQIEKLLPNCDDEDSTFFGGKKLQSSGKYI